MRPCEPLSRWIPVIVASVCLYGAPSMTAQAATATPYTPKLTYDVVSIHRSGPDVRIVRFDSSPHSTHFNGTNINIINLLQMAYGVPVDQILNAPSWVTNDEYIVQMKSDADTEAAFAALSVDEETLEREHMMQAVLEERFHIRVHDETRVVPQFELIIAKGGVKMKPSAPDPTADPTKPPRPNTTGSCRSNGCKMTSDHVSMTTLARMLSSNLHAPVQDKTGLTGLYDYTLEYKGVLPNETPDEDPAALPPLTTAIQDQLGLKVQSIKGPVRVYVVDHIEQPTEN